MIVVTINPDRVENDPIDKIIDEVRKLPGFIDVYKSLYYREWDVRFTFDGETMTETGLQREVRKIVERMND